ncbi:ly6/PLAUR domain-containing protein 6 isoform X2 [Larus michahellis]|uniref:ly6/PLAUR domain-containing protein 6 isoform X2 n=1 Tax=Larus michahellis TaxID=119627 RepID=UPI003D9BF5B2
MASQPAPAWVLLLCLLATRPPATQPRDFTVKDIVYLHPSSTRYCFSQHMMKVTGESVSVTKRCVPLEDCLSTGCTYVKHEEYKICTSCCEGSICNLPLPRNATDAVFTTLSPLNKTQRLPHPALLTTACLWLGLVSQHWVTLPRAAGPDS